MEPSKHKGLHRIIHLIPENDEDKQHIEEWHDAYNDSNEYIETAGQGDFGFLIAAGSIDDDEVERIKKSGKQENSR